MYRLTSPDTSYGGNGKRSDIGIDNRSTVKTANVIPAVLPVFELASAEPDCGEHLIPPVTIPIAWVLIV
ncbi:MAG: hypothetical protein C7B46_17970 [Sulfobacillus benefaciens]|uniref:Uncharacterized protein n=1 Tax=Sulfobacillus benefaciens TaxID=453960 RepID=A0A2T2X7F1_9FIRM|nr:MAG: hypothetical protein C7B46_17970 [Sulfobacillus benefaciens]